MIAPPEIVDRVKKVHDFLTVGAAAHPMVDVHYIEWIALETVKGAQRKVLQPGEAPVAEFALTEDDSVVAVYAYCNLHGLWKAM